MKLVLSAGADGDLDTIFEYTLVTWGFVQAKRYADGLDNALAQLSIPPDLETATAMAFGYRRVRYESHFIFYVVEGDTIRVERILHQRTNASAHLP